MLAHLKNHKYFYLFVLLVAADVFHSLFSHCSFYEPEQRAQCANQYYGVFDTFCLRFSTWFLDWADRKHDLVLALTGIAIAAFTGTLWWSTNRLWKASEKQYGLTRKIFAADIRPWLTAEAEVGPFENNDEEITLSVTYKVKNIGKSPALGVRLMQRLGIGYGDGDYELHKEMEKFSKECRAMVPTEASRRFGPTIFPTGEPAEIGWPSTVRKDVLNDLLASSVDKKFTIDVFAIIQYVSPSDNEWHQTRYIYNLLRLGDLRPGGGTVVDVFMTFEPDTPDHAYTKLQLHKTPFGAFAD